MATPKPATHHCLRCGKEFPVDIFVCPECKEILITPDKRRGPAPWVIVLLIAATLALFIYVSILFWKTVMLHQY